MTIFDTTRSTELSTVQVIVFPCMGQFVEFHLFSTHMNIRVLSKAYEAIELLAFHRVIALLLTDRDHEQKLCASSFSCTSELKSPLLSIVYSEASEYTINIRVSVSLAPSQENKKRSLMFGLSLHICLAKFHATLLVQSACREVSSGGCSSKPSAQGRISLMRFTFLDNASRFPFSFPNSILNQVHSENFRCVPP